MIKNEWYGIACGLVGGICNVLLNIDLTFWQKLFEGGMTAVIFGFLGMAGKHAFEMARDRIRKWKEKKKNNTNE